MPTTLLTGGKGFVGGVTLSLRLTSLPHYGILALRNPSSGETLLLSAYPDWDPFFITLITVSDFTAEGTSDHVFKDHLDIDYVVYCATPLVADARATNFIERFEMPKTLGKTSLLTAAYNYGNNVKAIADTGSHRWLRR